MSDRKPLPLVFSMQFPFRPSSPCPSPPSRLGPLHTPQPVLPCRLDLRYISDDQSFEGREVRDEASSVPPGYEPPNFQTAALQQTNVKLTWDAADASRKTALQRLARLTEEQIAQEDFKV
jgi:hypothetical protein